MVDFKGKDGTKANAAINKEKIEKIKRYADTIFL